MAARYEIIKDFYGIGQGQPLSFTPDKIDTNAYWVLYVLPFAEEVTFQRQTMKSYDPDPSQAVKGSQALIITSGCTSMQANQTKANFQGTLQAQLVPGDLDYLTLIFPGDWCAAWMLQSEDQAKDVVRRLQNLTASQPCNNFLDGLKFLGRVKGFREVRTQSPSGPRTVGFNLQAQSFSEMEAEVFFDPNLSESNNTMGNFFAKLMQDIEGFLAKDGTGIKTQDAIPFLLTLLIGKGIPQALTNPLASQGGPQIATGLTTADAGVPQEEAPYAYLVPKEVGAILGREDTSKLSGILSAADIDECLIGVQNFSGAINSGAVQPAGNPFFSTAQGIFVPDGLSVSATNSNHKFTRTELLGTFLPDIPNFTGEHTVWTILSQYVNQAVNEMYTCLRADEHGLVMPTVVIRQIPLTTEAFANSLSTTSFGALNTYVSPGMPYTRLLELPRWHIHPLLFVSSDIGRSDAVRFNFVHIYGQSALSAPMDVMTRQIVANPPIQDLSDIKRAGLRPLMSTVACNPADIFKNHGASKWMALNADWHMGMHLTLNGTLNIQGVQAPIAPGDNAEFDGVVYHIESVLHTCQIENDGHRAFYTTLQLSHGLRSDSPLLNQNLSLVFPDQGLYGRVFERSAYEPGYTFDGHEALEVSGQNLTASKVTPQQNPSDIDDPD